MSSEFLYPIHTRDAPALALHGPPPVELLVPRSMVDVEESAVSGGRVWVLLGVGSRWRLGAVAWVSRVARCSHDGYQESLSLWLDPARTLKLWATQAPEREGWWADEGIAIGRLVECSKKQRTEFLAAASLAAKVSAIEPPRSVWGYWEPGDGEAPLRARLQALFQSESLPNMQMPAQFRHLGLSAPCIRIYRGTKTSSDESRQHLLAVLRRLDPLGIALEGHSLSEAQGAQGVDLDLIEVTSDALHARQFAPAFSIADGRESAKALERAEQLHQQVVAGLCIGLRSHGYKPLMSRSVDLAFIRNNVLHLVEVKTVHRDNVSSQCSTGLVQVLGYEVEMVQKGCRDCRSTVVLAARGVEKCPERLLRVGKRVGVDVHVLAVPTASAAAWHDVVLQAGMVESLRT